MILETPQPTKQAELISVLTLDKKQSAAALNISVSTLDRLIRKGAIKVCKIGRRRVLTPQILADYVEQQIERRSERKSRAA